MNSLQLLYKMGVMAGTGKDDAGLPVIEPKGEMSRAMVAAMLHRFTEAIAE